ncbi:hypothetical protein GGP41_005038 [Bipolaris sorokiniana]|uniref:Uncharacterized protein n=1 Tax=Cochliobolus sativus TaxID=45130 RepID=A0A8H6DV66_COCSA|nr:hypothetical protein GGP41_005038 [Bipolaris sorokiniana]
MYLSCIGIDVVGGRSGESTGLVALPDALSVDDSSLRSSWYPSAMGYTASKRAIRHGSRDSIVAMTRSATVPEKERSPRLLIRDCHKRNPAPLPLLYHTSFLYPRIPLAFSISSNPSYPQTVYRSCIIISASSLFASTNAISDPTATTTVATIPIGAPIAPKPKIVKQVHYAKEEQEKVIGSRLRHSRQSENLAKKKKKRLQQSKELALT